MERSSGRRSRFLIFFVLVIGCFEMVGCGSSQKTPPGTSTPTHLVPTVTVPMTSTAISTTTSIPTPTIDPTRKLIIYPDRLLQTLRDVGGGAFVHYFGGSTTAFEPVSKLNWDTLHPSAVRVGMELQEWEPENDNNDPLKMDPAGFQDKSGSLVRATFEFIRTAREEGALIVASIWRVPGWMVENPEDERELILKKSLYPEVIESIASWLIRARDTYGVEVDYISFNEANLGVNVLLSEQDEIDLIRMAGKRFDALGLKTRWLLGDTSNMAETAPYAQVVYAAEDIRPYLGPLAFHSWDSTSGDDTIAQIGDMADANHLDVWCTEGGWNPDEWQKPEMFPSWIHAFSLAAVYTRALKLTRVTTFLYWQMNGTDYALNDGKKPYQALNFLSEFKKQFPSGSQVVETSPDWPSLYFTAAKTPDGNFSVIMANQASNETFQIEGLPKGIYYLIRSETNHDNQLVDAYTINNGSLKIEIEGFKIYFLTTRKP
jgi:O-glycosyl hydrolase